LTSTVSDNFVRLKLGKGKKFGRRGGGGFGFGFGYGGGGGWFVLRSKLVCWWYADEPCNILAMDTRQTGTVPSTR